MVNVGSYFAEDVRQNLKRSFVCLGNLQVLAMAGAPVQGLSVAYVVARHCEVPMVFARGWTAFARTCKVEDGALEDNYFARN